MEWYEHASWEERYFAVSVLGRLASADERALPFMFKRCGQDPAWQVNEALAMAFDDYCAVIGYENALPAIREWLSATSPNLRRAVSEGLRPWTSAKRAYFARNPLVALELLGTLRDDPSRYVQESVGNALRDISRKHPALVLDALRTWIEEQPRAKSRRTIARFALERAVKEDPSLRALYE
jgi:3-methyladenine DNA glycosylase AlkC